MRGNTPTAEVLRVMGAKGQLDQVVSLTERTIGAQVATDEPVHFGGTAVVFQYLNALLRHRHDLGKFVVVFFEEMPASNPDATNEVLGDLFRSIAMFFISLNRPGAARGAVSWMIRLHETMDSTEAPAKHFHDSLVKALIPIAQGLPRAAKDGVQRIVNDIEFEAREYSADLASIERLAKNWLLILKCAVGDTEDLHELAVWVANNDASDDRREAAKKLGASSSTSRARLARKQITKELRGR